MGTGNRMSGKKGPPYSTRALVLLPTTIIAFFVIVRMADLNLVGMFLLAFAILQVYPKIIMYGYPDIQSGEARRERLAKHRHCLPALLPGLEHSEKLSLSPRGQILYSQCWKPAEGQPRANIMLLHGYGDHSGHGQAITGMKLAKQGYAVYGLDYPGHGRSDGLSLHVPCMESLSHDCIAHLKQIREASPGLKTFLKSDSMGGAVALLVCKNAPELVDGLLLFSPMVKMSDEMKPPQIVINSLAWLGKFFPTLPVIPSAEILPLCFNERAAYERALTNPLLGQTKPRLATGLELLRTTEKLGNMLHKVTTPFMVVHGSNDIVTEPTVSKTLYEVAASKDKTCEIVEGAAHNVLLGESEEVTTRVYAMMFKWLEERH